MDPIALTNNNLPPSMLYTFHECVGHGNFGNVYKATNNLTNEVVAIKVIDLENADDDLTTISQEIFFLAKLKDPNITYYINSILNDSMLWIIMEYCGGGSCSDLLNYCYKKGLSESKVSFITNNVLHGLQYLHRQKIIHRDIKAANILLTLDGKVKIGDFGVSGQIQSTLRRNTFVGTPYWMAPEIVSNYNPDNRYSSSYGYDEMADIWSLGITVFELITGSPPLSKYEPMRIISSIPTRAPPRLQGNQYSHDIKGFIINCLQRDPHERATATELLQHVFILKHLNEDSNDLIADITLCNDLKWQHHRYKELNKRRGLDHKGNPFSRNQYDENVKTWDFDINLILPQQDESTESRDNGSIYYSSAISSNVLNEKNNSFTNNKMTVTPLTVNDTHSFKKYRQTSSSKIPNVVANSGDKLVKYDLGSGMEIDPDSKSHTNSIRYNAPEDIDYLNDIVRYSFDQMEMRATEEETKSYVNTLWQTFLAIENEVPGFSEVFVEEIMERLEGLNNYMDSNNCSNNNY